VFAQSAFLKSLFRKYTASAVMSKNASFVPETGLWDSS